MSPFKVSDVLYTDSDYRMYKLQFQAPPNVGPYAWRVFVVSDTYVGEDITVRISSTFIRPVSISSSKFTTGGRGCFGIGRGR